jgi:hypothetical protein
MVLSLDVIARAADVMEIWSVVMQASLLVMERTFIIGQKRLAIVKVQPDLTYLQFSIMVVKSNVCNYKRYPIDFNQSLRYLG